MFPVAARTAQIEPFHVMEVVKRADQLAAAGRDIIHLSIGEPDCGAAPAVSAAAIDAIERGLTRYTPALGLPALREAIAADYARRWGVALDPGRVVVTAGASGALNLVCNALVDPGREVLMADPGYPCNRHFVTAAGGVARLVPAGPAERYQLGATAAEAAWSPATAGLLVASPANPTGTSIAPDELKRLLALAHARGGFAIVDEIYLGLSYDAAPVSAVALSDEAVVIGSFSKYQAMTGWRLGWIVAPPALVPVLEKLAQNLTICASAVAQHAALACFTPESEAIYQARRAEFRRRRDFLVPALRALGFGIPVAPDGAFFIYADISRFAGDSQRFALDLLEHTGVCLVPGQDFGHAGAARHVRISYANALDALERAVERMAGYLVKAA